MSLGGFLSWMSENFSFFFVSFLFRFLPRSLFVVGTQKNIINIYHSKWNRVHLMHCILKDLAKFFIHCYSKQTTVLIDIYICFSFTEPCHPYEPFKCPGDGNCISIQYLCDGAPDCSDGYDEDARLCTAGNVVIKIFFLLLFLFYVNHFTIMIIATHCHMMIISWHTVVQ